MFWLLLLLLWLVATVCLLTGSWATWHVLKTRHRRQLESAEAKWHLQHQQASPATVIENISLGWLNILLQSLWMPVLEKHVAGLTTELLQKVFCEVLVKGSQKAPWKYLDGIEVEELRFGLVPPTLQVASAKFDPAASMLTLAMDVRFVSNSAQAVLLARSKQVGPLQPLTVRMEATHIKLRGRLRLALVLGQEPPGIMGMYYSFVGPPHLDVAVRPLGLPLPSILPGVDTALKGVLSKLINRRMVEPQRRYLDIHRIYMNKHIARVGGPGGLLKVIVLTASNLTVQQKQQQQQQQAAPVTTHHSLEGLRSKSKSGSKAAVANSPNVAKLSSYCEVRFGRVVLRTPIVHHTGTTDASWNWQFSLALPFELDAWPAAAAAAAAGSDSSDEVSLVLFDAQTVGQLAVLGKTKVSLSPLQLQPNGPARILMLPLHKASSSRANVQVSLQWLKSTKQQPLRPPQQQQQQRTQRGQQAVLASLPAQPAQQQELQMPSNALVSPSTTKTHPLRSTSAFEAASKGVTWQDKAQLRVKSATTAAKRSFNKLVNSSLDTPGTDREVDASSYSVTAAVAAAAAEQKASTEQQLAAAPWAPMAVKASDDASSSMASVSTSAEASQPPHAAADAHQHVQHATAAGNGLHTVDPHAAAPADASSSWLLGWKGLGSYFWPDSSAHPAADGAQAGAASTGYPESQAGARSLAGSPRPDEPAGGAEEGEGDDGDEWHGLDSPGSGVSTSSTSPLLLLSHVVHMQKELEQQRAQLEAVQQQLEHTANSYQRLKQVCRQRGRSALLQGARFLLHSPDGTTQHVLLYIGHAGSSRGGQPSRLGRQQQQPDQGSMLVIAALPETRREARLAFRRLAAGESDLPAAADADGVGGEPNLAAAAAARSSAGGAGGVGSTAGAAPRLSAFGSVGAGLRLRLQRGTLLQLGYESGKLPRSALQVLKSISSSQLVGVVRGNAHFAAAASGTSAGGAAAGSAAPVTECFTLMVQEEASGYVTAINLQLPLAGNGRCLDEWILALRDVAAAAPAAAAVVPQPVAAAGAAALTASGRGEVQQGRSTASTRASSTADARTAVGQDEGPVRSSKPSSSTSVPQSSSTAHTRQPSGSNAPQQSPATAAAVAAVAAVAATTAAVADAAATVSAESSTHHALEGHDWVLPAAAGATPKPWPAVGSSATGHDSGSSSEGSDSSDGDD